MSLKNTDYSAWLVELKAELAAGHPDTGAYSSDDAMAADQINAANRQASQKVDRASIRQSFLRLGGNAWNRLVDDARAETIATVDMTPVLAAGLEATATQAQKDRTVRLGRRYLHVKNGDDAQVLLRVTQFIQAGGTVISYSYDRENPSTAEFVALFETNLVSVAEPLNMYTEPVNALLIGMRDTDGTLGGGAVTLARQLSDVLASRSTELWGTSAEPTEGGTTLQVNEQVVTLPQDITAARAL